MDLLEYASSDDSDGDEKSHACEEETRKRARTLTSTDGEKRSESPPSKQPKKQYDGVNKKVEAARVTHAKTSSLVPTHIITRRPNIPTEDLGAYRMPSKGKK